MAKKKPLNEFKSKSIKVRVNEKDHAAIMNNLNSEKIRMILLKEAEKVKTNKRA